ncbi:MAG: divalent-cation tolerance protein CutA [Natrialbaceae archaeon]|nr:divalent-cation tolerance protein CutA [Natrialbaceae archaeon]
MPTVYCTVPPAVADDIAETLVSERLAACVNRFPIRSTYWWEGSIEDEDEVAMLVKTTETAFPALCDRIEALHPYDVPCIERFDESEGLEAYLNWRNEAVGERES